jgi:hypothetical protein
MRRIDQIEDYKFKQEAYDENEEIVKGKVVYVNIGKPQTHLQRERGQQNGYGRIKSETGQEIFFWQNNICEHLDFQRINYKNVNAINIKPTDRGFRATRVECDKCAEPEIWEIVETEEEVDGIPKYTAKCTNKPNLGREWIPTEVTERISELNKPFLERREKRLKWGNDDKIKDSWFFITMGKPEQIYSRNGNTVLVYKDFGEKILTPNETYSYSRDIGFRESIVKCSDTPKIEIDYDSENPNNSGGRINSKFIFTELPDIEFDRAVAEVNEGYRNFLSKTTEYFLLLDELTKDKVYQILKEKKFSIEKIANKIFKKQFSYESDTKAEAQMEKLVNEIAMKLAILEFDFTSQTRSYGSTKQVFEPESPDEMRGGFYYTENIIQNVITIAPKLESLNLLSGVNPSLYTIKFEGKNGAYDEEANKKRELDYIEAWKNSVLSSLETIELHKVKFPDVNEVDSKIYEVSGEEFLLQLKKEYQLIFDAFILRIDEKKKSILQKFKEALEINKNLLNQIPELTTEIRNLEEKARKKGITNIPYFRIENTEYFENLSNDQLNNYIKRFNEHKEIVEELISKKESEENLRRVNEEVVVHEENETFAKKAYRIFKKILSKEEVQQIREINESEEGYYSKRTKITDIIVRKSSNLDYESQRIVDSLTNSISNSKFLNRIFEILLESEAENTLTNKIDEETTKSSDSENLQEITNELEENNQVEDEAFSDLNPTLKPLAFKFIDLATSKGLEEMQTELYNYIDLNNKNKQEILIRELLGEGEFLEMFLQLPTRYKTKVINSVIDELEYLINNEQNSKS